LVPEERVVSEEPEEPEEPEVLEVVGRMVLIPILLVPVVPIGLEVHIQPHVLMELVTAMPVGWVVPVEMAVKEAMAEPVEMG
jgi:hypothetical protein